MHPTAQSLLLFARFFQFCLLWPWPLTSKINRVHPLIIGNICAKFDQINSKSDLCWVHKIISFYPLTSIVTSKINMVYPLVMVNMSARFDEDVQRGLVSIVLTKVKPWRTDRQQRYNIPCATPCAGITNFHWISRQNTPCNLCQGHKMLKGFW